MSRIGQSPDGALPRNIFRYTVATSGWHQLSLLVLTVIVFLLEIVPLELQRRAVDDLVKHRPYSWIVLIGAVYAASVAVQGGIKLALNIYRGWVGERAKQDLRRRITAVTGLPQAAEPAAEGRGIAVAMIVAEVEPIGGFVGESISEPLLQAGILVSVLAYIIHIDRWMALAALLIFLPQLVVVPVMQRALNRRTGTRVRVLRQLGIGVLGPPVADDDCGPDSDYRIQRVFALDMGIFRLKFTMNFLMNLGNHLQVVAALLIGGWWVYHDQLLIGGVVAFISGIRRLNDPWGDLVNYFRDVSFAQVRFRLLAEAIDRFGEAPPAAAPRLEPALLASAE